ncbi:hypothetical protein FGIG_00054 [Fasciola gigantica]|uniref:Uncharacterized protein n=1 Tax=Fasciola gigantica TaxID=46835 RepID=A0A504Y902_FASGI|nr:hypothetical protein FGIG_00054 [Fasciola gigantica]
MQRLLLFLAVLSPFVHCVLDDDDDDDVHVAHGERLSKPEFDACVKKCGDQYENCSKAIHTLWLNFRKNRQKITAEMVKCCLAGETDHSQPPTLSFATCVRDNCHAEMWGCNIKKRHSGFLSEDEKLGILERENREKERMRKLRSSKPFRILP